MPEVDWTAVMPIGHENPYTPPGEIEQIGKFASGMRRATGWRRTAGWLVALAVLLPFIVGVVALIIRHL